MREWQATLRLTYNGKTHACDRAGAYVVALCGAKGLAGKARAMVPEVVDCQRCVAVLAARERARDSTGEVATNREGGLGQWNRQRR